MAWQSKVDAVCLRDRYSLNSDTRMSKYSIRLPCSPIIVLRRKGIDTPVALEGSAAPGFTKYTAVGSPGEATPTPENNVPFKGCVHERKEIYNNAAFPPALTQQRNSIPFTSGLRSSGRPSGQFPSLDVTSRFVDLTHPLLLCPSKIP